MSEVQKFLEHLAIIHLNELSKLLQSDVMVIYGPMSYELPGLVRNEVRIQ